MTSAPLYIEPVLPQRLRRLSDRKQIGVPPIPPYSELPSKTLLSQARVDYRRLCEVEHNVRCSNICLVSGDCLKILEKHAARLFMKREPKIVTPVDVMDLP